MYDREYYEHHYQGYDHYYQNQPPLEADLERQRDFETIVGKTWIHGKTKRPKRGKGKKKKAGSFSSADNALNFNP